MEFVVNIDIDIRVQYCNLMHTDARTYMQILTVLGGLKIGNKCCLEIQFLSYLRTRSTPVGPYQCPKPSFRYFSIC